ncbi:MAG: hypothetical protein LAN70_07385 [Acidobacteriia bacterium]|nr:hypothetical protein [Terriglobia bacterium]
MAGLLNSSSVLMCPHLGTVSVVTSNTRVKGGGDFLLRSSDTFTIKGCTLNVSGAPHPCIQVQWMESDLRSKAAGDFTLSEDSVGMCVAADQAPQGTVLIQFTQPQVSGE